MASDHKAKTRHRTPKLIKTFLQSPAFRAVLYATLAAYARLIQATTRWTIVRGDIPERFWRDNLPFVLGFWHGRVLVMPMCWRTKRPINMLASQHRDGDITQETLRRLGLKTLRGSSGNPEKAKMAKGGALALRTMARLIQAGESVGITPDGPRGPRMRAGDGIAAIARLTGVPVIPAAVATRSGRVLTTWDRMFVPLPFSAGVIVWGQPIRVAREGGQAELERARLAIESGITRVTQEADSLLGRAAIEPAPAEPERDVVAAAT
jgi:hypothetical protein